MSDKQLDDRVITDIMLLLDFLVISSLVGSVLCEDGSYTYTRGDPQGPENWGQFAPTCDAATNARQSPVDISDDRTMYDPTVQFPQTMNYDQTFTWSITNNGKHVTARPPVNSMILMMYDAEQYVVDHFHFHWGSEGKLGSEHTINGHRYHAEMHVVHRPANTANVSQALQDKRELVVLASIITLGSEKNYAYDELLKDFEQISIADNSREMMTSLSLESLLPAHDVDALRCDMPHECPLYMYDGGLTTPSCDGLVRWIVSGKMIMLDSSQMDQFDLLKDEFGVLIVDNWRPVQELGARMIRTNLPVDAYHQSSISDADGYKLNYYISVLLGINLLVGILV